MTDLPTSHRPRRDGAAGDGARTGRWIALAVGLGLVGLGLIVDAQLRPPPDRIVAGVTMGGVALGGRTIGEAAAALAAVAPSAAATVTLVDDGAERTFDRSASELGLTADALALAERAFAVGREGGWLARRRAVWAARFGDGVDLPIGAFDAARARLALEALSETFAVPPQAADLRLGPDGQLEERTAVPGRSLDIEASLAALADAAERGERVVRLVSTPTLPRVFDLSSVTEAYKLITSAPVTLRWRDGQSWTATVDDLAAWARVEARANDAGDEIPTIVFDAAAVTAWLAPVAPAVAIAPSPARFAVENSRVVLREPARMGYALDVAGTIERLVEAAYSDGRTNEVAVAELPPASRDAALEGLSTATLVVESATGTAGLPDGMRTNLGLAAARIDGLALAPGATFSLLEALGPIGPEGGYQMLFITPLGDGAEGTGGGISQAATTLFRLALHAGLPIVERHAHPTRLGWVEPPVGLDATVAAPARDLRFANDTGGPLLIVAQLDDVRGAVTMALYGTAVRRTVRLGRPAVGELSAPPPPIERVVEGLPAGARAQVGWAREGARVTVERVVEASDGPRRETFESRYRPAPDVFVVGGG